MAEIIKGNVNRSSVFALSPDTIDKEKDKIVAPATGKLQDPKAESPEDSFIQAMEAAKGTEGQTITGKGPASEDSFINAIDSGDIDLSNLDYQYSGKDMTLMGKFDRLKYLRSLKRGGRITSSRYISLKQKIGLSLEEAALLEAEEIGRAVDPEEIKSDPVLLNKYGFVELDSELADTIEELQRAGVDVTAGAPANIRKEIGRQSNEEYKLQALNDLQEDGQILHYKPSKLGMIITIPTINGPKDVLLDEVGLNGKDFLDMISEVPGIAANIAGVTAAVVAVPALATGGVMSLAGISALSGLSYFVGASASDIINRYFTEADILGLNEIAKTRGTEAAIAAGLDALLLGGVKFGKGVAQKFIGPVAGSGDLVVKNYLKSIAKGKQVIQYDQQGKVIFDKHGNPVLGDMQLTPGLATQSPTIQRIEGIAEKIPGSADVLAQQKAIIEKQLIELENRAKGILPEVQIDKVAGREIKRIVYNAEKETSADVGEEVSRFISRQLKIDERVIAAERSAINTQTDEAIDKVASSISSKGDVVKTQAAGDIIIDGVKTSRNSYVDEINKLDNTLKNNPNYKGDMEINTSDINAIAKKLEESFPTKTTSTAQTKPPYGNITETTTIFPKQLKGSIMDDLKNLDNLTLDQARKYKGMLRESLSSESIPTEADVLINKIIKSLDLKINEGIRSQGLDVVKAYNNLQKYESLNGGSFEIPIIKKVLNGDIPPEEALIPAIMQGDSATIRAFETVLGKNNPALADAKSAALNEMIRKSRSSLGDMHTSPQVLWDQISNLPESSQKFLLGKDYKKVKNLLDVLAVERGIINVELLSNMKGNLANKLEKVIGLERAAEKNWKNKFLKPFLKDKIGETEMNVADFTKYFLNNANPNDIINIMNKFSPKLKEKIKKRVIQEILESGRSGDPDLILKEFASKETPPHPSLYKAIFKIGGGDETLAREKLNSILGIDVVELLEDVAGIQAARRVTQDVASAAGGLITGSIINQLTNLKFGNVGTIIKYRIAAKILSNPTGRAWLTSQKELPAIGPKTVGISAASREIFNLVSEEFENEPELKKIAINELERINEDYFRRVKEDKEYNERVMRNRQPIEESNQASMDAAMENIPSPVGKEATAVEKPVSPPVNNASRLATAFAPQSLSQNTGQINPNTAARGAALFNKPGEITFAAEGGIMNAHKQIQRVA
mgnify:CR=1 FL=1